MLAASFFLHPADSDFLSVELHRVRLSLGERPVLRGIDWSIAPGQRWLLLGSNGAGKTALLRLIAGQLWPNPGPGRIRYDWRGERFDSPYGVREHIAYLGSEAQDRYERYEWNFPVIELLGTGIHRTDAPLDALSRADHRRIAGVLRFLDLQALAKRRFLTLSYGERRLVLLARVLLSAPRLLLLDELLNGLDATNRARALHCLANLNRSALPWVLSSHRDEEVPAKLLTHALVLQAGRVRFQGRWSGSLRRWQASTFPRQSARAPRPSAAQGAMPAEPGAALIRLNRATVWREGRAVLRDLNLELYSGQCWVVHGANGSGKSSFIQLLYGDLGVARGGSIERAGIVPGVPLVVFKRRLGLVAPELQAMHPREARVDEAVAAGVSASIAYGGEGVSQRLLVQRALRRVGAAKLHERTLRALSYGQLRRVLFARALVREPDILLLDEPYTGLDPNTRARLAAVVERQLHLGVTVVLVSHHAEDWPHATTHELQLADGNALYAGRVR